MENSQDHSYCRKLVVSKETKQKLLELKEKFPKDLESLHKEDLLTNLESQEAVLTKDWNKGLGLGGGIFDWLL